MSNRFQIGTLIRQYRQSRNITIEELAKLVNVCDKTIVKLERNETMPRADTFIAICSALNIRDFTYFTNESTQ